MKKLITTIMSLVLVLALACSFAACSDNKTDKEETSAVSDIAEDVEAVETSEGEEAEAAPVDEEMSDVEKQVSEFAAEIEAGFVDEMGLDGDVDVYTDGNIIIIDIKANDFNGESDEEIEEFKTFVNTTTQEQKLEALATLQEDVPSVEGYIINFCDIEGNLIAALECVE